MLYVLAAVTGAATTGATTSAVAAGATAAGATAAGATGATAGVGGITGVTGAATLTLPFFHKFRPPKVSSVHPADDEVLSPKPSSNVDHTIIDGFEEENNAGIVAQ